MYLTEPTMYGATLPRREFIPPFHPFYGSMPYGNLPMQFPWQSFERFVPPFYQQGVPPYFFQNYGQVPQLPFQQNYGHVPQLPFQAPWHGFQPMQGFQRPLWY